MIFAKFEFAFSFRDDFGVHNIIVISISGLLSKPFQKSSPRATQLLFTLHKPYLFIIKIDKHFTLKIIFFLII